MLRYRIIMEITTTELEKTINETFAGRMEEAWLIGGPFPFAGMVCQALIEVTPDEAT